MVEPRSVHWVIAKHVLCYLSGTVDFGLDYRISEGIILVSYIDLDWAGSVANQKSTYGCRFSLCSTAMS